MDDTVIKADINQSSNQHYIALHVREAKKYKAKILSNYIKMLKAIILFINFK